MIGCITRQSFLNSQSLQSLPVVVLVEKFMYSHFTIIEKLVLLNSKFILQKMSFLSFLSKVSKTSLGLKILILSNSSITLTPFRDSFCIVPLLEINGVLIKYLFL